MTDHTNDPSGVESRLEEAEQRAMIERARAYLADVRQGHVSRADEGAEAVITILAGYVGDLVDFIDGQHLAWPEPPDEQRRLRAQLRQALPARYQASEMSAAVLEVLAALPGDIATTVVRWLEAGRDGGAS